MEERKAKIYASLVFRREKKKKKKGVHYSG